MTSIRFFEDQTRLCDAGALHAVGEKGLCWNCRKAGHYPPGPTKRWKRERSQEGRRKGRKAFWERLAKAASRKGDKGKDKGKPKAKPKAKSKGALEEGTA